MKGEYLIYGIATTEGATGWSVIGTSIDLDESTRNVLVKRTAVGHLREADFTDQYGYFGTETIGSHDWAVFAHFYRSLEKEKTGNYFVQRDICIAPLAQFRECGADAAPFFRNLPPKRSISRSGERLATWDLPEHADPIAARLKTLANRFDAEFIKDLLVAALQETPTVLVGSVDRDLIPTLLLLLPPTMRASVTFSTIVAETSAPVSLQVMPRFPSEAKGTLVEIEKSRFVSKKIATDSAAVRALVDTWLKHGVDTLIAQQNFLDAALAPRKPQMLEEIDIAQRLWTPFEELRRTPAGDRKWELAKTVLGHEGSRRPEVLVAVRDAVLRDLELPSQLIQLINFIRDLRPAEDEDLTIAKAVGVRLAGVKNNQELAESIRLFDRARPNTADTIVPAVIGALPPERRTIELALALRKKLGDIQLPASVMASWTMGEPRGETVSAVLAMVRSPDEIRALRSNKALLMQIESSAEWRFSLALRDAVLRNDDRELLRLPAGVEVVPALTSEEGRRWLGSLPNAALALTARLLPKAKAADAKVLADLFADAWQTGVDRDGLTADELKAARATVAKHNVDANRRLRVSDYRLQLDSVAGPLSDQVTKLANEWKSGSLLAEHLLDVLHPDDDGWPTAPIAWAFLAELIASDLAGVRRLIEQTRTTSRAEPLLRMLAVVLGMKGGDRVELLPECLDAIADLHERAKMGGEGRYPIVQWTPRTVTSCDLLGGLAAFFHSRRYAEQSRNALTGKVSGDRERSKALLQRLVEVNAAVDRMLVDVPRLGAVAEENATDVAAAAETFLEKTAGGVPLMGRKQIHTMLENLRSAIKRGPRSRPDNMFDNMR